MKEVMAGKFETIGVGDEVALPTGFREHRIARVDRVTATRFVCGDYPYRKSDGKQIGSTGWETRWAQILTQQLRDSIERETLLRFVRGFQWHTLTLDDLRHFRVMLESKAK